MSQLALSDSFEYLSDGSTTIRNIFTLTVSYYPLQSSESDVYRRQILTTKVDPRAVRVKGTNSYVFHLGHHINIRFDYF